MGGPFDLTGKAEWGLVKAPDGGVMGVYGLSGDKPLKTANFRLRDREFEGAARYPDWKFVYSLPVQNPPQQPGAPLPQAPLQRQGVPSPTQ